MKNWLQLPSSATKKGPPVSSAMTGGHLASIVGEVHRLRLDDQRSGIISWVSSSPPCKKLDSV
jgi:hypothetical protein